MERARMTNVGRAVNCEDEGCAWRTETIVSMLCLWIDSQEQASENCHKAKFPEIWADGAS